MKKELDISNVKFVYTKDELSFQEVVDEMANARNITIITYNISEKHHYLLDCIKKTKHDAEIKIITNIPSRWDTYFGDKFREVAQRKISVYLSRLNPEDIGERVSVYFNFNNHGKIIMTEEIAYMGSANYSEESKQNIEFGFITRDKLFIEFLCNEIVPEIEAMSTQYYLYNYAPLLIEAAMVNSALFRHRNDLHEETHLLNDHRGIEVFYYNTLYDSLNKLTLEAIDQLLFNLTALSNDISDAIGEITNEDAECMDAIHELCEQIEKYVESADLILQSDTVLDLASFNLSECTNSILENEYGMLADNEHLEECIERSSNAAANELMDLAQNAEIELEELIAILDLVIEIMGKCIDVLKKYDLKKVNPEIDNT